MVSGGEECAHFHESVWGEDVFSGDGAGDGGGVEVEFVGDVVHGERAEVARAFFEEHRLVFDEFVADGEDGFLAEGDGADEAAAVADLVAEELAGFGVDAVCADHVFVEIVDAEAGEVFAGEACGPAAVVVAFDDDVWEDVGVSGGIEVAAGVWGEAADAAGGFVDAFDAGAEGAGDEGVAFAGEVFEVIADDAVFDGFGAGGAFELEEEGFLDVGRADAGRVEGLDEFEGGLEDFGPEVELDGEVACGCVEEAAFVEVSDDSAGCGANVGVDHGEVELVDEVLLEGFRCDDGVVEALAAFFVLVGPWGVAAFHDFAVAPVVVGFVEVFEGVCVFGIGAVVIEGDGFGDVLEDGVGFESLADEEGEFHRAGLEDFQAFAHLGRKGLLLRERLMEVGFGHLGRGLPGVLKRRVCKLQQLICHSLIFLNSP